MVELYLCAPCIPSRHRQGKDSPFTFTKVQNGFIMRSQILLTHNVNDNVLQNKIVVFPLQEI